MGVRSFPRLIDSGDHPYDVQEADEFLICDTALGSITVNLPPIATMAPGRQVTVLKIDSANAVTLSPASGEDIVIQGTSISSLAVATHLALTVQSDGIGSWHVKHGALSVLPELFALSWVSVPHGDLTFTAQAGNWTVAAGDLSYFRYAILGKVLFVRGAIINSSVSATPTELRVAISGIAFGANDSFGYAVYTEDGFATQDTGQAIARAANDWIAFKPRTGGTWATTTDLTGVIFNLVAELE